MAIPRVVPVDGDGHAELMASVIAILTVPEPAEGVADAVVAPIGQGEEWRLAHAIRLWESDTGLRHLLVANGNPAEATHTEPTLDHLRDLGLTRQDGVLIQAEPAPNTALQAAWIAERVDRLGLRGLRLAVSAYHLPRVYLTVLKAFQRRGLRVPMFPAPAPVPLHGVTPETGATGFALVPGEMTRIQRYADEGWIATAEELREYLEWLWLRFPDDVYEGAARAVRRAGSGR